MAVLLMTNEEDKCMNERPDPMVHVKINGCSVRICSLMLVAVALFPSVPACSAAGLDQILSSYSDGCSFWVEKITVSGSKAQGEIGPFAAGIGSPEWLGSPTLRVTLDDGSSKPSIVELSMTRLNKEYYVGAHEWDVGYCNGFDGQIAFELELPEDWLAAGAKEPEPLSFPILFGPQDRRYDLVLWNAVEVYVTSSTIYT